ncbi:MAG: oligopeptide/dipeptide transporter, ATPase subunit [Rubritepida sp.]|nr:oligopeptide/dipeptide transporter, ATPase subunit [Rubritepida sp.]
MSDPVLTVRDLRIVFGNAAVVDGVSFDVMAGEIVGIVGESGSGKSLTARAVLQLVPPRAKVTGAITFEGQDILSMNAQAIRALRGTGIAMVFQDPMTSFNPVLRVGDQIGEAITVHAKTPRRTLLQRVRQLLAGVGIPNPAERAEAYPHEYSGGMRQRALTAMALANDPRLLIADEPTTALDVTVQDQILRLMRDLNARSGTAILLITHNIAVVASLCQRVIVMYAGRVVEDGPVAEVLTAPLHPYTRALLQSVPRLDNPAGRLAAIAGQPPDPADPLAGCRFQPRCASAIGRCAIEEPALDRLAPGHRARCWVAQDQAALAPVA